MARAGSGLLPPSLKPRDGLDSIRISKSNDGDLQSYH